MVPALLFLLLSFGVILDALAAYVGRESGFLPTQQAPCPIGALQLEAHDGDPEESQRGAIAKERICLIKRRRKMIGN